MVPSDVARLRVYLVSDRTQTASRPLLAVIEQALSGGVRAVQIRERGLEARELFELARAVRALTRRYDALLLINDRIDVALACDADGVHLPTHSFRVADARTLVGPKRLIGVSTHHVDEVSLAAQAGADFAVFGPVYDTPSKQAYGPPVGLAALEQAAHADMPVLAIGGITTERIAQIRMRHAAGVAVIRAILAAPEPARAAEAFVREVRS